MVGICCVLAHRIYIFTHTEVVTGPRWFHTAGFGSCCLRKWWPTAGRTGGEIRSVCAEYCLGLDVANTLFATHIIDTGDA